MSSASASPTVRSPDPVDAADAARRYWRSAQKLDRALPDLAPDSLDAASFRLLADNLPTLCWLANGDGYIVWYNRRWHEHCGTTPEQMEGWGWRSVHHPDMVDEVAERWSASIAAGEPFEMTFPLRGADGAFRHFLTRATPVYDATGRVARWCGVNTEVEDLVAAEAALRRERDRYTSVLDGMGEAFALLDRDFRVVDLNPEAMRHEGRPREQIVGRTHWEAWPGTEASELGALYKHAMRERAPVALEHCHTWPDGREVCLDMRAFPVEDGLAVFYRDVSDRKETERDLAREAARVRLALDAGAIVGTWFWDLTTDRFTVDEAFARAFGIDPAYGRDGLSLEQVIETVHPDDKPGLGAAIAEAIARGGRYAHQYRVRRADGRYYWIEANGRVDKDAAGLSVSFPGVLIDVEDRRALVEERDRAMRLLETFIEAVPGVVYAKDRDGRMLVANRGVAELAGKPVAEILGRTDAEFLDDAEQARAVMVNDRRIMERGVTEQVEEEVSQPDGTRAVWFSTKTPLRDDAGAVIGLIGSSVDITRRKVVEAALRDSEARYRTLFDSMDEGFCLIEFIDGPDGTPVDYRHVEVNAAYGRHTGLGDVSGRTLRETIPDEADAWLAIFGQVAATGEPVRFDRELEATGRHLELTAFPVEPGGKRQVAVLFQDVTDRKRAEAALRDLNATLERRVAEAVAEREQAQEALRQAQKMEAVGQLTGGIAHDFNNLLTIVIGNIDMGKRALEQAGGDARTRRVLDSAQKGAERAAALTQRLLAFSRRQPLAPKPTDVDKLVSGMSDMLNRALGEVVRLEIVTSPGLWRVEVDPNQLESAVLNLAVNARDAMPRGGDLTIETANARLDEEYSAAHAEVAPGQYVVISVTDTGQGIPKPVLDRVFDPFFTTKEVGKGTGLGLSQVYGFVKQSGGHVKIYSEEGRGTTVKLYLPRLLTEGLEDDEASLTRTVEGSPHQETILVVEDDDDVRAYTVECLRELGYRVLEAHDGPSALRLLERQGEPIELLFTDVVMPGMSGSELAEAARATQGDLKVLFTSGYTRNAIVHGGRLDAGVEMVAKPFTFETLAQKVRDMLDKGRTMRVLLVEHEPTVRALAVEALGRGGYAVEEAANAAECLSKVRAAQGRYDAVLLDADLPDQPGEAVAAELRAMHADLPVLLTNGERAEAMRRRFADDRCVAVIDKPFTIGRLNEALKKLRERCAAGC